MKSHSARYAPLRATVICRAALARGPLILAPVANNNVLLWTTGRRKFSSFTVNALISAGEAVRDGDEVRML